MNRKIGIIQRLTVVQIAVLIVIFLTFYLYQITSRTAWGVEQSFMFWPVKAVAVDHKYSLIGTHFFSLTEGAIYRAPYFDWIVGTLGRAVGLSINYLNYLFAVVAFLGAMVFWKGMEAIGGRRSGFLAVIFLVSSWFVRVQAMTLWNVAWMISLMGVVVYLLFARKSALPLGLIVGFGFSFHLVILWIVAAIYIYWIFFEKEKLWNNIKWFTLGLAITLLPLIAFNIKHQFIMSRGIFNMLTGGAPGYRALFPDRLAITWITGNILSGGWLVFLGPLLAISWWKSNAKIRRFVSFSMTLIMITLIGIFASGQKNFSSVHYGIHLLPIFAGLGAVVIDKVLRTKYRLVCLAVLVVYFYFNFVQLYNYQIKDGYEAKSELAKFIFKQTNITAVKFMDADVLNYDGIFYLIGKELHVPENKVRLLERWNISQSSAIFYTNPGAELVGRRYYFGYNVLLIK